MNDLEKLNKRLAYFQAILPSFYFGRSGGYKVVGFKQTVFDKKVAILWNPLLCKM